MRELRDPRDIFSKIWYYDKVLMIEDLHSFHQRANIHNRGVLLVLGADKKCGDATRIIIIGNLRFRIRQDQCKLFIRINFFVFLIVFNVFSDSID